MGNWAQLEFGFPSPVPRVVKGHSENRHAEELSPDWGAKLWDARPSTQNTKSRRRSRSRRQFFLASDLSSPTKLVGVNSRCAVSEMKSFSQRALSLLPLRLLRVSRLDDLVTGSLVEKVEGYIPLLFLERVSCGDTRVFTFLTASAIAPAYHQGTGAHTGAPHFRARLSDATSLESVIWSPPAYRREKERNWPQRTKLHKLRLAKCIDHWSVKVAKFMFWEYEKK